MKKKIFAGLLAGVLVMGMLGMAQATSITYNLNTIWENNAAVYIGEMGTLTLTDNGTMVDIDIDLINDYKILKAFLNYGASVLPDFKTLNGSGNTNMGVLEDKDKIGAPGYPGQFDLQIPEPPPGNVGTNHYSDSIYVDNMDLDPSLFSFKDTQGMFYVGVHMSDNPFTNESISIFDGSQQTPVPEPGTMMLLGAGLLGLAIYGKRRMNKEA